MLARLLSCLWERFRDGTLVVDLVSWYARKGINNRALLCEIKTLLEEWEVMACGCCFAKRAERVAIKELHVAD